MEHWPDLRADLVVAGIPTNDEEPLDPWLLKAIQPRVIILSAAEYPASEQAPRKLRRRLEETGVPVFYTSDHGALTVTFTPDGWTARSAR
jgi:beta-lactamase superfamily II metal-dependent hydrolase